MSPPEPVTMASGMRVLCPSLSERGDNRRLVVADPGVDVFEDLARGALRPPVRAGEQSPAVRNVQGYVSGPFVSGRLDGDLVAGNFGTQSGQLAQREADLGSAADVDDLAVPAVGVGELALDQLDEVVD